MWHEALVTGRVTANGLTSGLNQGRKSLAEGAHWSPYGAH